MTVPRSFTMPSPGVFTASDPNQAYGHKCVACHYNLVMPYSWQLEGQNVWFVTVPGKTGRIYQAEGDDQAITLINAIRADASLTLGDTCVVTNGLAADLVSEFVKMGITSMMTECYAQQGDEPYGDLKRMTWQAHHDGWPHVIPVLGVYDNVNLQHYIDLNGGPANFKGGHWRGGPLSIFLAEGMTDTGSWPTLASLC